MNKDEIEKEAESYTKGIPFVYETELVRRIVRMFCKDTFEYAVEYGYNKANEEMKELLKEAIHLLKNSDELYSYQIRDFQLKCEHFIKE